MLPVTRPVKHPVISSAVRRAALGLTTVALTAGALTAPATAAAAGERREPTAPARAAAGWLVDQLDARDLVVSGYHDDTTDTFVRYVDHGLTLDVFFALKDLGVARDRRDGILDALETRVDEYVASFGGTAAGSLA